MRHVWHRYGAGGPAAMRLTADVPEALLSPPPLQPSTSGRRAGDLRLDLSGALPTSTNRSQAGKSRAASPGTSPHRSSLKAPDGFIDAVWGGDDYSSGPHGLGAQLSNRPAWGTQTRPTTSSGGPASPGRVNTAGSSPGRSKRYGSWYVPPKDWHGVYKEGGPGMREEAQLLARVGHAGSALPAHCVPTMEEIEAEETLRLRKESLKQALSHQYSVHVYREHLRTHNLPEPHNLTSVAMMSATAAAHETRKHEATASAAAAPAAPHHHAPKPHPRARPSTRELAPHAHPTHLDTAGGGDPSPRKVGGHANSSSTSGAKPVVVRMMPVSGSPIVDLDIDDIISPEMRAAVRRTLAMNDRIAAHEQQVRCAWLLVAVRWFM